MPGLRYKFGQIEKKLNGLRVPRRLKRRYTLPELQSQRLSRDLQYHYFQYFFDHYLPEREREHRKFFSVEGRGFGEDAFHAMWYLLWQHFRPTSALEVGVFRGQTITLWKLLAETFGFQCSIGCISPFKPVGDTVSRYNQDLDYLEDVIANHKYFGLPLPQICQAFSTDPEAHKIFSSRSWDVIYIDGSHDYDIAKRDWEISSASLSPGGLIVMDDSALGTDFQPPLYATKGHPGPSKVAEEVDRKSFTEILAVGHNRVFQRIT